MKLKRLYPFYINFFKSTLVINVPISVAISIISAFVVSADEPDNDFFLSFLYTFMQMVSTVGLFATFMYKQYMHKDQYYFYRNVGISKLSLLIVTFLSYCFISMVLYNILKWIWNSI